MPALSQILFYQETLCTPAGTECYKYLKENREKCVTPCNGVFAGVDKDKDFKQVEEMEDFKSILEDYKEYKTNYAKRGFTEKAAKGIL